MGTHVRRHGWRNSAPLLLFGLAPVSTPAAEQQSTATGVIEEVEVTGIRQSLRDALSVKMNSDLVVDAISSEDIGQLPDVTIAESINRLPGINATRDRGNDSQAVVRGLGARLVLGTINGREVASSEPDRNVRWEIYPSEVVSGVKVYKTQSADLIAGGVAATIDIATLQPLDYDAEDFVVRMVFPRRSVAGLLGVLQGCFVVHRLAPGPADVPRHHVRRCLAGKR
jgi:iron complex outermembrane receptor protein